MKGSKLSPADIAITINIIIVMLLFTILACGGVLMHKHFEEHGNVNEEEFKISVSLLSIGSICLLSFIVVLFKL